MEVPPIISRDTWERAQQVLDENKKRMRGRPTQRYLLTKHFRCVWQGNVWQRYVGWAEVLQLRRQILRVSGTLPTFKQAVASGNRRGRRVWLP